MNDRDTDAILQEMGKAALNVIGFHDLAEDPDSARNEVQRLHYEAQVYANGVALARLFRQLAARTSLED